MSLFDSGIRPQIDEFLEEKAAERRDYGDYWSASNAGYCMRKVMFDRLQVPYTRKDARKQRVFEVGHVFHEWIQRITLNTGLSILQEAELKDEKLKVCGHIDDLVTVGKNLLLYDYKTQNSRAFSYQKDKPMSYFHKMQLGTYMYMLRQTGVDGFEIDDIREARILKISKDDMRMVEQQLIWSLELESEVNKYWGVLNGFWKSKTIPHCTCAEREGGFMAKEAYNDYFYKEKPCSVEWFREKFPTAVEWDIID